MATPLQVYTGLTKAGASTIQAIGIMANMINESEFNEEAVGDNGTSFGLVQEHGSQYASLVTGNRSQDFNAQIRVLAQNGGFAAASGATPEEAAGNFAAKYERCDGCQVGGNQWQSRVGNVSTVAGWVTSGKWPKSAGSPSAGGTAVGGETGIGPGPSCLLGNPFSASLPLIGNISAGPSCLFSASQARALIGGLLMIPALVTGLTGAVLLVALGFRRVAPNAGKAAETVGAGLVLVPGLEGAGLAVAGAGAAAQRSAPQTIER
ncbi:MAG TPA: phage tail tip lysozyme, partial [Streptosporangiaceae bacterium]|nr:phage tail tip lysozyme [Streptosporangiaceae bacterium]